MHVVRDLAQARQLSPLDVEDAKAYVTIGVFDGVHRGHQQLITEMVGAARSTGSVAVALTFDPHPALALGHEPPPLLTTLEERIQLLAALGLDILVVFPFTPAAVRTSASDFSDTLMQHLRLAELWAGRDFALGYQRQGDMAFLRRLGRERGFIVHVIESLEWQGALVSSSRVRAALEAGDIPHATGCLGRPYRLTGTVVHGDGRGHSIGVPTANISPPPERLIPASGIYACLAHSERPGTRAAVTNVGTRPTFDGGVLTVEAHLLDFDADLYGQSLSLDFVARLRDEWAFPTVAALVEQIEKDIARAREVLGDGMIDGLVPAC